MVTTGKLRTLLEENSPIILSSIVVISFFAASYALYSHDQLPIGWDTPRYITQIEEIRSQGVADFVQKNYGYNIVYPLVGYLLTYLFFSPLQIEVLLPIALCVLTAVFGTRSKLISVKNTGYLALALSSWFAIYRLGSDLHSNLLSLLLLVVSIRYFVNIERGEGSHNSLKLFAILLASSFTHVETTIFFVALFSATIIIEATLRGQGESVGKLFTGITPMLAAITPAATLYIWHLLELVSYSGGELVVRTPLELWKVAALFTVIFPLALAGYYTIYRKIFVEKQYSRGHLLLLIWASTSLVFGLSQYVFPSLQIFSERALILFPTPFLAAIYAGENSNHALLRNFKRVGLPAIATTFVVAALVFASMAPLYQRTFITSSAYNNLSWLKDNYDNEKIVLIFNNYDAYAGDQSNLAENWASAILGEHYAYIGLPCYLANGLKTPFNTIKSQQQSNLLYDKLTKNEVLTTQSDYQFFILTDFYHPNPIPSYIADEFTQVHEGVLIRKSANTTITIPFIQFAEPHDAYYPIEADWADSKYSLNLDPGKDAWVKQCELQVPTDGKYRVEIRYLDGEGANTFILLDGEVIAEISYTGDNAPKTVAFSTTLNANVPHELVLEPQSVDGADPFLSLDYLSVTLS